MEDLTSYVVVDRIFCHASNFEEETDPNLAFVVGTYVRSRSVWDEERERYHAVQIGHYDLDKDCPYFGW